MRPFTSFRYQTSPLYILSLPNQLAATTTASNQGRNGAEAEESSEMEKNKRQRSGL